MNAQYSKEDTQIAKGVACCLLLLHHLFFYEPPRSPYTTIIEWKYITFVIWRLALSCKVCVSVFLILSGYGLNESYKKSKNGYAPFVYKHLVNLMMNFWFIFLVFVILGCFLGRSPQIIYGNNWTLYTFLDFIGMGLYSTNNQINPTWWYMGIIIAYYILFPLFKVALSKAPYPFLFAVAMIHLLTKSPVMLYTFPFVVGMFLSEKKFLIKTVDIFSRMRVMVKYISLISILTILFAVRYLFLGIKADTCFALAIMLFTYTVMYDKSKQGHNGTKNVLQFIGKHSANIFYVPYIYL